MRIRRQLLDSPAKMSQLCPILFQTQRKHILNWKTIHLVTAPHCTATKTSVELYELRLLGTNFKHTEFLYYLSIQRRTIHFLSLIQSIAEDPLIKCSSNVSRAGSLHLSPAACWCDGLGVNEPAGEQRDLGRQLPLFWPCDIDHLLTLTDEFSFTASGVVSCALDSYDNLFTCSIQQPSCS